MLPILAVVKLILGPVILIAFWVSQHIILGRIQAACKAFKAALPAGDSPEPGTAGTAIRGGFTWLYSVVAAFAKDGQWVDNPPLPRDAVIDHLDNEIWRFPGYNQLQRLGLAAPLVGVILSGFGFIVESVTGQDGSAGDFSSTLRQLAPLFMGVVVGALMALVNQFYLYRANATLAEMRLKAALWFDEKVWGKIREKEHNALGSAALETQKAAEQLRLSSAKIVEGNQTYQSALNDLTAQIGQVQGAASRAATLFDSHADALIKLTEKVTATIGGLGDLSDTAAAVETSGKALNESAQTMKDAAKNVNEGAFAFYDSCNGLVVKFESIETTMESQLAGAAASIKTAADQLQLPLNELGKSVNELHLATEGQAKATKSLEAAADASEQLLSNTIKLSSDAVNGVSARTAQFLNTLVENSARAADASAKSVDGIAARSEQFYNNLAATSAQAASVGDTAIQGLQTQAQKFCNDLAASSSHAASVSEAAINSLSTQAAQFYTIVTENSQRVSKQIDHQAQEYFAARAAESESNVKQVAAAATQVIAATEDSAREAQERIARIQAAEQTLSNALAELANATQSMKDEIAGLNSAASAARGAGLALQHTGGVLDATLGKHNETLDKMPSVMFDTQIAHGQAQRDLSSLSETTNQTVNAVSELKDTVELLQKSLTGGIQKQPWAAMPPAMTGLKTSLDALVSEMKRAREAQESREKDAREKKGSILNPMAWFRRRAKAPESDGPKALENDGAIASKNNGSKAREGNGTKVALGEPEGN